jgi:hypothetical protein
MHDDDDDSRICHLRADATTWSARATVRESAGRIADTAAALDLLARTRAVFIERGRAIARQQAALLGETHARSVLEAMGEQG